MRKRAPITNPRRPGPPRDPAKHYQGKPCRHGHSGIRYTSNKTCVECSTKQSMRAYHKVMLDPVKHAKHKAKSLALFYKNHERRKAYTLAWRRKLDGLPAPTRPVPPVCESCARASPKLALNLDHCHVSGKFRGWLCAACNRGLGLLGDTEQALLNALAYVRRSQAQ